jgi:hypothetical protein
MTGLLERGECSNWLESFVFLELGVKTAASWRSQFCFFFLHIKPCGRSARAIVGDSYLWLEFIVPVQDLELAGKYFRRSRLFETDLKLPFGDFQKGLGCER